MNLNFFYYVLFRNVEFVYIPSRFDPLDLHEAKINIYVEWLSKIGGEDVHY